MNVSALAQKLAVLVVGLSLLSVAGLQAQAKGSLSDLDIEYSELKVTLDKVVAENKELRDALSETQRTLADMRKNLASAHGETEIFKRQAMELKLRVEALGLETAGGSGVKLEQRLLAAVSDLRVMADERSRLSDAVTKLSEIVSLFVKTATGSAPEARLALEAALRDANQALGPNFPSSADSLSGSSMSEGRAVSVRDDLALVVINLGSKQGVKVGMPFQVLRADTLLGSVRVVDVREKIAGAVIQNLSSEKNRIQVGDRLKVDARQ